MTINTFLDESIDGSDGCKDRKFALENYSNTTETVVSVTSEKSVEFNPNRRRYCVLNNCLHIKYFRQFIYPKMCLYWQDEGMPGLYFVSKFSLLFFQKLMNYC